MCRYVEAFFINILGEGGIHLIFFSSSNIVIFFYFTLPHYLAPFDSLNLRFSIKILKPYINSKNIYFLLFKINICMVH